MSERQKFTRTRRGNTAEQPAKRAPARKPRVTEAEPAPRPATKIKKTVVQPATVSAPPAPKPTPQPAPRPRRVVVSEVKKTARPKPAETPVILPSSARTETVTAPLILKPEDMPPADRIPDVPLTMPEFKGKGDTVERVQDTIREADTTGVPHRKPEPQVPGDIWHAMPTLPLSAAHLERNRIISATRRDPAHTAFDVLRTRLLQALDEKGWSRVAITSPTKDCGKTFIAANLAMSLSRQEACRTLLLDMDLRAPSLAKVLGAEEPGSMGDFLRGITPAEQHFSRLGDKGLSIGRNIAVGLNGIPEGYASELLQLPETHDILTEMHTALRPDVVLYDMPPALFHDDVMAFRPHIDGVLLVIGGGITKASEVREVERRLGENTPLLGVIMNKAEGPTVSTYSY